MKPIHLLALALLVTLWSYAGVRSATFVYEDDNAVKNNPAVQGLEPIQLGRARWLSALSHRIVMRTLGPSPQAAHAVNLALHLSNGGMVYALALSFVSPWAAALTSYLFLLHPLQTESVAYAASRSEVLSTCFALIALLLAMRAARWWQFLVIWVCVAAAVCAKESSAVVIPILVLCRVYHGRKFSPWLIAGLLVPVFIVAASVIAFDYKARSILPQLPYMATQSAALWRYLAMIVVPMGQSIDHDFELVAMGWRWLALFGVYGLASLAALSGLSLHNGDTRESSRLWHQRAELQPAAFGIAWALIAIGPRFLMRIPEVVNEHQLYLPMVGLSLALATPLVSILTPLVRKVRWTAIPA